MAERIRTYKDLRVYQKTIEAALRIFQLTKGFPPEEKYSMADQMRRSSRSVSANIAEAWRKRRDKAAFISKLNDAEGEVCETQVWLEIAMRCSYLSSSSLDQEYNEILGQLVRMIEDADKWLIKSN